LLAYDCRLCNQALASGQELVYRNLLEQSDIALSPQALVLSAESTWQIATAIVKAPAAYQRTVAAARAASDLIRAAVRARRLKLSAAEAIWLDRIAHALDALPEHEDSLIGVMMDKYSHLLHRASYAL